METARHIRVLFRACVLALAWLSACRCAKEEAAVSGEPPEVSFGAYVGRGVGTRAGAAGTVDNASLRLSGFGVFAFHTGSASYSQQDVPGFMYNTQVTGGAGSSWVYSPVKYWPNECGQGLEGGTADRVSFFAYAPYVAVDASTGGPTEVSSSLETGIVRMTRSTETGDPRVWYRASFDPDACVDLCWADPLLDERRPASAVAEPVSLVFRHALAALCVQVDAAVDGLLSGAGAPDGDTRIYVRYVSFEGFAREGVLNLGSPSSGPLWGGFGGDGVSRLAVTVYDGRMDSMEARYDDPGEYPVGLNGRIVQKGGYDAEPGVTGVTVNLFDSADASAPVAVVPNGYPLRVTIEYDVETRDDKLVGSYLSDETTHGSVTRVCVRQAVVSGDIPLRMEAGRKYVLRLHLGMTGVLFEAGLTDDWTEDSGLVELRPVTMGQERIVHPLTGDDWY